MPHGMVKEKCGKNVCTKRETLQHNPKIQNIYESINLHRDFPDQFLNVPITC